MPKLFAKPKTHVKMKLTLRLPGDVAERLKRLTAEAEAAGLQASVEEAIVGYLIRAIGHAEGQMRSQEGTS